MNAEKSISYLLLVGMWNAPDTLENSLAVSYKSKQAITIGPSNHSWLFIQITENFSPHKILYMNAYSNFNGNSKKWEIAKNFSWEVNQIVAW